MAVPRVPRGTGGEVPGLRRPGLGPAGSARSTRAALDLTRKHSHAQLCWPRPVPPSSGPRGLWSPRSRRPRLAAGPRAGAAGLEQRLPGLPGSAAAREGRRERRREDSWADARQQSARLSRSARRALRLLEPGLRRRPVTLRGRAQGAGVGTGARGGLAVTPVRVTPPPGRGADLRAPPGDAATWNQVAKGRMGALGTCPRSPSAPHPHHRVTSASPWSSRQET